MAEEENHAANSVENVIETESAEAPSVIMAASEQSTTHLSSIEVVKQRSYRKPSEKSKQKKE